MPAFSFEKISPPVRRAPAAPQPGKRRGIILRIVDRLTLKRAAHGKKRGAQQQRSE
jgi:hypothetical protein